MKAMVLNKISPDAKQGEAAQNVNQADALLGLRGPQRLRRFLDDDGLRQGPGGGGCWRRLPGKGRSGWSVVRHLRQIVSLSESRGL